MSAPTVAAALAEARVLGIDRLDAQLLLGRVLGQPRTWVLAHAEAALDPANAEIWRTLARRRAAGEPLAYLLGEKEFHGLLLRVNPGVLIPRPETEILVDRALAILQREHPPPATPQVVDLGTGSGALAIALKARRPGARVHASDLSREALDVAVANAERLGLEIEFRAGSWWAPWGGRRFDVAVANPPYVAEGDPHLTTLGHEPVAALIAGGDGLSALREIVARAPARLAGGGWLLLEHGFEQGEAVRAMLRAAGFTAVDTHLDLARQPRCTVGRR